MDLVQACRSRGLLVETPIMGFGLYTVAFVGVYAINFPHMDPDGFMCGESGDSRDAAGGQRAAREALEAIGQMRSRLPMATNWFRTIHRVHRYYEKIIGDYNKNTRVLAESSRRDSASNGGMPHHKLSLREGGTGNGGEGFHLLEKTLKEFGKIDDEDTNYLTSGEQKRRAGRASIDSATTGGSTAQPRHAWTAINSIVNPDDQPNDSQQRHSPHQAYASDRPPPSPQSASHAQGQGVYEYEPIYHAPSTTQVQQPYYTQPQQHSPRSILNLPPLAAEPPSWLHSLRKPLGGDDVAAFVDGRSIEEWAGQAGESGMATVAGLGMGGAVAQGWLLEIWGG